MRKVEIRNNTAIFLDHRELINNTYNKDINTDDDVLFLRPELFYFHEHRSGSETNNTIQKFEIEEMEESDVYEKFVKTKKRKKNHDIGADTELLNLQALVNDFLQQIKQNKMIECSDYKTASCSTFPRYWEEITTEDFPKFNGANTTASYHHCHFGKHSYVIPPHCIFFNNDVLELTKLLPQLMPKAEPFDLIILDPPWRNKYIRRIKRARKELGYQMLNIEQLRQIPIKQLIHERSIVAIWCTNCREIQRAIMEELLPIWNLKFQHKLYWFKLNTSGKLIAPIDTSGLKKQPFEMLYIACHMKSTHNFGDSLKQVAAILSVPSIVHSHKPPLLPWLSDMLPTQPNCLEIFARYLQPQFTSIGLEVLKLMDERLYSSNDNISQL